MATEIGFADHPDDPAHGVDDDQVTNMVFLGECVSAGKAQVCRGREYRVPHLPANRCFRRAVGVQVAQQIPLSENADRHTVFHHQQGGDVRFPHLSRGIANRTVGGNTAQLPTHDLGQCQIIVSLHTASPDCVEWPYSQNWLRL